MFHLNYGMKLLMADQTREVLCGHSVELKDQFGSFANLANFHL